MNAITLEGRCSAARYYLASSLACLVLSCADGGDADVTERGTNQPLTLAPTDVAAMKGNYRLPGAIVDKMNRKWNCQKKAKYEVVEAPPTVVVEETSDDTSLDTADALSDDLLALSTEELADAIAPVTLIDGYECVGERNVELARKLKEHKFDTLDPSTPASITNGQRTSKSRDKDVDGCCGIENRELLPTNDILHTPLIFSEVGCTASFIHPSVAITAAHCLFNTVNNTWLVVRSGPNTNDVRLPFYREAVQSGSSGFGALNCYMISVPGAFASASSDWNTSDYAYIDFSRGPGGACANPTPAVSWFGTLVASNSQLQSTELDRAGYPGLTNQGGTVWDMSSGMFHYSSLNGTWGSNTFVSATAFWTHGLISDFPSSSEIRSDLDASHGDSGSPLNIWTGQYQVVGTHRGWKVTSSWGTYHTYHRRWDWTFRNFVADNTPF